MTNILSSTDMSQMLGILLGFLQVFSISLKVLLHTTRPEGFYTFGFGLDLTGLFGLICVVYCYRVIHQAIMIIRI